MKFTLATIAIAAFGVSAVESSGIFTHASFRQATSSRKFDTLQLGDSLLPGMSAECKAVFSPAVAAHMLMAPIAGQPTTAASIGARCTPALMQDFQTKWAATEAVCTEDELGVLSSLGATTEGLCLKVDGEYCELNSDYGDTAKDASFGFGQPSEDTATLRNAAATCCDGDFGSGGDSTISNVGRKWGCYNCNCRDYSDKAVQATVDCDAGLGAPYVNTATCCDGDFGLNGDETTITNVGTKWGCYNCNCKDLSDKAVQATTDCDAGLGAPYVNTATCCDGDFGLYGDETTITNVGTKWGCYNCNCKDLSDKDFQATTDCDAGLGQDLVQTHDIAATCCDGDFGPGGDDTTITNVGRKWGCSNCNCKDYSDKTSQATADCESGRAVHSHFEKMCGNKCLKELVKLNFMAFGDVDPAVAEFMVNLYCLKDSNDKICGVDRDKDDCTSSCARDTMSSLLEASKDKDLYCKPAPVAPVANAPVTQRSTFMETVHKMFVPYCEDKAKSEQDMALLELKCMTNEDGAFCQDALSKYPDVCPKKPCDPTEPKTCSAACAAEMQSIADSSKCCVSEQKLFALKYNMARCELDVYDSCSTTFKSPSNSCNKAFPKISPPPTPSTTPPTPSTTPPTPSPTADGFISASTQLQASLCSLLLAFAASLTLRV